MNKIINLKNINKTLAIAMVLIIMLCNVKSVFAISGSGSGNWTGGQYDSYFKTTESIAYNRGILIRKLTNVDTGEKITVFCAEHTEDFVVGTVNNGNYYIPQDENIKRACKVAYFGWYSKYNDLVMDISIEQDQYYNIRKDYAFTQQMVWEALGQSNASFIDESIQNQYNSFKNDINNKIANIYKRPSFDFTTVELDAGTSKTLTDTNNIFKDYATVDATYNGIRFRHNKGENTLTIDVPSNCTTENMNISDATFMNLGLVKEESKNNDTSIYFEFKQGVQNQLYSMHFNDPVTMALKLKINLLGNLELSKLNSNGDLIDGSIFNVSGTGYNGDVEVKNGKITLEKIKKGTYTIKEKTAPTGYLLNTQTYTVQVNSNETAKQAIINNEPTGEITINKEDSELKNSKRIDATIHHGDVNIAGAEYTLYADEDIYNKSKTVKYFSKDEPIANFTFNEDGKARIKIISKNASLKVNGSTLTGLALGNYYSKETKVPTGYIEDTEKHTYSLNYKDSNTKVISVNATVKNTVQKAKFKIIKISGKDNDTAKVVKDAEFTAILTKYVDYYGSFDEALKHLDKFAKDEYSIFKTDENGYGVSNLLAYGEYTVNETVTPSPELNTVEEFYVTIDRNSDGVIKELVENDTPFESYLKIIKIDENTGKKITFSNATFSLYKLNKENNEWEQVSCKVGNEYRTTWSTNNNAVACTENKLTGGIYKIEEIQVPDGFVELKEDCIFEINNRNNTLEYDEDFDAYITVTVKNKQAVANVNIIKTIDIMKDADLSIVDTSDLSGIKFKLTAKENILDMSDGSIIYEKGKEIDTYNLGKDGRLTIKNLPLGIYEIQEIETLKGLILDETKYEIALEQEDNKTELIENSLNIVNTTSKFEFSKTDITGDKELESAVLQVVDEENNIIDEWVSGKDSHKIEGLEIGKTYKLIETIAPNGYVKSTEIEFKVKNTKEIQKVTMIDKIVEMSKQDIGGNEIEGAEIKVYDENGKIIDEWTSIKESHIINGLEENKTYTLHEEVAPEGFVKATDIKFTVTTDKETQKVVLIDKVVYITKTDITTNKELEGAKLEVTDEDGNIVDKWTSTNEPHHVKGLEENRKYTLTEITAPYGYEIAESIDFIVSTDKETQKIEMKDMPILKNIRVIKIDSKTKETIKNNFMFGIYENPECTKLINEVKSNNDEGTVLFENLRFGTYYIKELQAPKDYELSNKVVKLEINDKGIFVDDIQKEEKDNTIEFAFENKKIEAIKTPKTGDERNLFVWLALLGVSVVSLIAIGVYKIINNKEK